MACGSNIDFYLDCQRTVIARELFKTKEEAQRKVDKLNNDENNRKRAIEWNSYENKKKLLEMRWID